MIETRKQLRQYLKLDGQNFSNLQGLCGVKAWYYKIRCNPISNNWIIWAYIKALRHVEYYINISKGGGNAENNLSYPQVVLPSLFTEIKL